jgi:hypothetical protein
LAAEEAAGGLSLEHRQQMLMHLFAHENALFAADFAFAETAL